MKLLSAIVLMLCVVSTEYSFAQEQQEKAKREVINLIAQLFEGMKANDSAKVAQTFHPSLALHTSSFKAGKPHFAITNASDFLKVVGSPKPSGVVYDERILQYDVKIDDGMASVWTPYEFYVGEKFSHCGVNAFHCVLTESGWKITHITDTRRKEPCQIKK